MEPSRGGKSRFTQLLAKVARLIVMDQRQRKDPAEGRTRKDFSPPRWAKPAPLGYGQAADAAHFIAAPLLASTSVVLIGVITSTSASFRWPGPALLAMSLAAASLVGSIQYGFHARNLLYSVNDLEEWWGHEDFAKWTETLRDRQRAHFHEWQVKINRAVTTYNVGITLLGAGVALSVAPPVSAHGLNAITRWVAASAVAAGTLGELGWTVAAPRKFSLALFRHSSGRALKER